MIHDTDHFGEQGSGATRQETQALADQDPDADAEVAQQVDGPLDGP
jgi:hypothetical protein